MGDIGKAVGGMILTLVAFAALAGVLITLFCIYAVPWLWNLVKSWLHAVTG